MSIHTKNFLENIISKNYLSARENLKKAVDETINKEIESQKEIVRSTFSDT